MLSKNWIKMIFGWSEIKVNQHYLGKLFRSRASRLPQAKLHFSLGTLTLHGLHVLILYISFADYHRQPKLCRRFIVWPLCSVHTCERAVLCHLHCGGKRENCWSLYKVGRRWWSRHYRSWCIRLRADCKFSQMLFFLSPQCHCKLLICMHLICIFLKF